MSVRHGHGLVHLAASVDQPGPLDVASCTELARLAERGGLDFVTLDDTFARTGPDALAVLARVAPATRRIGLVPTIATHGEPSRVRAAMAELDRVSRGRAGWRLDVSAGMADARPLGTLPPAEALWPQAVDGADLVAQWWDGREGDAGKGHLANGRCPDRGRPRDGGRTGTALSLRDPSVLPRPSAGRPVRVVDAGDGRAGTIAARYADVALVRAVTPARAAALGEELRARAVEFGRAPHSLRVLVSLLVDLGDGEYAAERGHGGGGPRPTARGPLYRGGPVDLAELVAGWHADGAADGFHLVPVEPRRDLERLVNGTVALLQHRGLFRTFYPGSTLREHLGLALPADRPAVTGGTP
ncbi:LLM class flavin-dependent oxidoreductase [Streptomyces sp. NPDC040750]|uniref:LLM class flavin-dependent oxidoreductase n=1 Tax=Streptomyces sp. NPDC040750 TaxID=3154491 RepID=UPI0033DBCE89